MKRLNKYTGLVRKNSWKITLIIISIIAAYPFIGLSINWFLGWNWGKLYTFEMSLEDFISRWIAFWVFVGAGLNVLFMQRRVSIMEEQQKTQQKQLLETRFSKSVELLGNDNESVRIGGIYSLYYLARDHEEYQNTICEILCAHVRTLTSKQNYQETYTKSPASEIQTILDFLCGKNCDGTFYKSPKNLRNTFLHGAGFRNAKLSNASFYNATLHDNHFMKSMLDNVDFIEAKLSNVTFELATLSNVDFLSATFTNIDFRKADLNKVCFAGTYLERYEDKYEEITRQGRSLELTKPKIEQDSTTAIP